jgi:hypothetical protein
LNWRLEDGLELTWKMAVPPPVHPPSIGDILGPATGQHDYLVTDEIHQGQSGKVYGVDQRLRAGAVGAAGGVSLSQPASAPLDAHASPPTAPEGTTVKLAIKVFVMAEAALAVEDWEHEVELMERAKSAGCLYLITMVEAFIDQATGLPCIVMLR